MKVSIFLVLLSVSLADSIFTDDETRVYEAAVDATPMRRRSARKLNMQEETSAWRRLFADVADDALKLPTTSQDHCKVVTGSWCGPYYDQVPAPRPPAPRGNKACPNNCNSVGTCDYDHGTCSCPVGYGGSDCSAPRTRPCWRMGKDKRDTGWHKHTDWSHARCAGVCDEHLGMCYCPPETKYGHVLPPEGSPPGTPPLKRGRPMFWCQPSDDINGTKVLWGAVPYKDLLGKNTSWCDADLPKFQCPCRLDGTIGTFCNIATEHTCMNACSGHGRCDLGFCQCHDGYYGIDCSRRRAGLPLLPGDEAGPKPWLNQVLTPVISAMDPPITPTRKRPFIYVYDTKPDYHTDILQYRIEAPNCMHRLTGHGNHSDYVGYNGYALETLLLELMLTSEHRTFDPEEADFFYVPLSAGCFFDVIGWNPKAPHFPAGVNGPRPLGSSIMMRHAQKWLNDTYPWMQRRGGRDHIWLSVHDEGACYAPKEVWPGLQLTHWGRMDFPHRSNTQYQADNYSTNVFHAEFPQGWIAISSGTHPCYDPQKDLVIPLFKQPNHYSSSPYLGNKQQERKTLLFFKGDVAKARNDHDCIYSRCIRQTLYNLSKSQEWRTKHNVLYGSDEGDVGPGGYTHLLSTSVFCFVLPGDGYSARMEDAVLHGCIPVIIMDATHEKFESILDFSAFTLRVAQADMLRVLEIVQAVPPQRIADMQASLAKVWHRFRYNRNKLTESTTHRILNDIKMNSGGSLAQNPGVQFAGVPEDDAFSTIIQWLHSRQDSLKSGA